MQILAAKSGNEGSSGLILAHSLKTDTALTPWNTYTQVINKVCIVHSHKPVIMQPQRRRSCLYQIHIYPTEPNRPIQTHSHLIHVGQSLLTVHAYTDTQLALNIVNDTAVALIFLHACTHASTLFQVYFYLL